MCAGEECWLLISLESSALAGSGGALAALALEERLKRRRGDLWPHSAGQQKKKVSTGGSAAATAAACGQKTGPAAGGRAGWRRAI